MNTYSKTRFDDIRDYPKYWAIDLLPAPFLPMSRKEMDELGWDSCDIIIVTGDAYIDHPSFGTAIVGRFLELMGFRVGVISQPDWHSKDDFMKLGRPNLFFGVNAGNMDSMINHYTADRKIRTDDSYTPNGVAGKRPDRAVTVYSQRLREAFKDIPIIIGGIEASLRRAAHYDYWSDTVKNSVLADSKADILVYGNGERPLAEIAYRLSMGESIKTIRDVRNTAVMVNDALEGYVGIDFRSPDNQVEINPLVFKNPYDDYCAHKENLKKQEKNTFLDTKNNEKIPFTLVSKISDDNLKGDSKTKQDNILSENLNEIKNENNEIKEDKKAPTLDERVNYAQKAKGYVKTHENEYLLLPSAEKVKQDKLLYALSASLLLRETNPYCARALMQKHGQRYVWINPPAFPLTTDEMDYVYSIKYQRVPHPSYNGETIPAYEMIKTSVSLMRGCFGGCSFCSIVAHEGKIIQSRSEDNVIEEIEEIKDKTPDFTGIISDLGGPSANMYRLGCTNLKARNVCRKVSCLYPEPCKFLNTDHSKLIELYRKVRALPFIKKVLIASGVRIDLALLDKRYIKELVMHHVGGYLKIAPEHTEPEVLSKMLKPGTDVYYRFKELFESYSSSVNKTQYLIPYFMSSHPGSTVLSMIKLALWLKENGFRLDQVQNFYPTPMAGATTMYYTGIDPYDRITSKSEENVFVVKGEIARRTQKQILRYHDSANFRVIRDVLRELGLNELIGRHKGALVPPEEFSGREQNRGRFDNRTGQNYQNHDKNRGNSNSNNKFKAPSNSKGKKTPNRNESMRKGNNNFSKNGKKR